MQGQTCKGVINCATYQDTCTKCAEGYTLKNNTCVDSSAGCAQVRPNDGLCSQCKDGYFLSGYKCFENKLKDNRCYVLASATSCLYCKSGYNQLNGKCLLTS